MKSRTVLPVLCFLVLALFSWSVSGNVELFEDDTEIVPVMEPPATDLELPLSLVNLKLELDESDLVCEATEPEWNVEDLDQLLEDQEQQAISCPSYFYQLSCSACGSATQQCLNEGQPAWLCVLCAEVCRCNAIDCPCY